MDAVELSHITSLAEIDGPSWDALVARESPFLEHGFLWALEASGCVGEGTSWQPLFVVARSGGRLVGALPMYVRTDSTGEFVFDQGWAQAAYRAGIAYYPKAVVAVPFTPVSGARLLVAPDFPLPRALRGALAEHAIALAQELGLSSVHFNFVGEEDREVLEQDLGLPVRLGVQYHWVNGGVDAQGSPREAPYGTFEDFLGEFRSKRRANIRRERRDLTHAGVEARVLTGEEVTPEVLARVFGYYRETTRKFMWGRQYLNKRFFELLGHTLTPRLHVVQLEQQGQPFGAAFNLVKQGRLYGRHWGCAQEVPFAHFEACIYRPVQWCIAQGIGAFEPGAGGEHKYERGFQPVHTCSAHYLVDPRLDAAVRHFLQEERAHMALHRDELLATGPLRRPGERDPTESG